MARLARLLVPTLCALGLLAAAPRQGTESPMLGFTADHAARQRALEVRFDSSLDASRLEEWVRRMSSAPNHVGSPHDRENAEFVASLFRSWGYQTEIDTFQVLFPTPTTRLLELTTPTRYRARLAEPRLPQDGTSGITRGRLPPYNAYSADGDVTAPLVYVNYGIPDDYDQLARLGVDVKGKIVIARYGGSWRGIKPKVAAEHGAVGCIIYSDPRDDGYYQGDVYPKGSWRMEWGAQRGSVMDMPIYPGDPLTPGVGATKAAHRLAVADAPTIMKIPVLPISYGDAQPLLAALGGPVAPDEWRGALGFTYHVGPGPATVHLKLAFDWSLRPLYDVIARMPGAESPDEWVVRGNHRDAWVFGADDPLSGMVAVLEEARAVGELAKTGWRPKRTIVFASWDGEEPGLIGSTEWAEQHEQELDRKAVVYINTDANGRGFLGVAGSHALQAFVNQVARDVPDPETHVSLAQRLRAVRQVRGGSEMDAPGDIPIGALGSGSDYTPFLQHDGIASLNLGFGGEDGGGSYHSIFDSFDYYERFGDPGFKYGIALVQTAGRMTLRFADADVLPFVYSGLALNVEEYLDDLMKLPDRMRQETERRNALRRSNAFRLAADPTEVYFPPDSQSPVPHLDFSPVQNALDHLTRAAAMFDSVIARKVRDGIDPGQARAVNALLASSERLLTDERGLPGRPWFRHMIYAPGLYTGYGVKTLPGVREAIEQRNWSQVAEQMPRVAGALERLANALEKGAAALGVGGTD
jgi:N-acetylated-alpha-linked acidic dipeptidase